VAFSPDGKFLATAGYSISYPGPRGVEHEYHTYLLWDGKTFRARPTRDFDGKQTGTALSMAFSPDGEVLVLGLGHIFNWSGDGRVQFMQAKTGKHLATLELGSDAVMSLAFSPTASRWLLGTLTGKFFDSSR